MRALQAKNDGLDKATPVAVDFSSGGADGGITLDDLLRSLWAKKLQVIIPVFLVSLVALFFLFSIPPQYSSNTSILVEDRQSVFSRPQGERPTQSRPDELAVASHVQLLLSNDLARRVVADQGLSEIPEFNLNGKDTGILTDFFIMIGLSDPVSDERIEEKAVREFFRKLSVYSIASSRVIEIVFSSTDPVLAARIANSVADEYVEMQREAQRQSTREAASWLEEQIDELRNKVEIAEAAVERYRSAHGLLLGSDKSTLSSQQLTGLTRELVTARTARAEAQVRAQMIREMLNSGEDLSSASDVLRSNLIQRLQEQLVTLQRRHAELSATMLPSHPRLREVQADLTNLRRQVREEAEKIVSGLENEARIAGARENALRASLNSMSEDSERLNGETVELRALEREAKAQRDLLETFLGQFREATARADLQEFPTEARIVSRATVSSQPSFPKKLPILLIAIFSTTFLAIGILVSIELMSLGGAQAVARPGTARVKESPNPGFQSPVSSELEQQDSDPPLQTLRGDESQDSGQGSPPRDLEDDFTPEATPEKEGTLHSMPGVDTREAVKRISRLVSSMKQTGEGLRVFVSSPQRQSMRNHAAINLARQLSNEGARVVLIDSNIRASRIAQQAGLHFNPGFAELLNGNGNFAQVLQRDPKSRLHIITTGSEDIDLLEDLSSDRLEQLLDALEGTYTYVILDGPPAMLAPEAVALAAKSDVAVLVPDTLPGGQRMTLRAREVLNDHGRQPVEVLIADPAIAEPFETHESTHFVSAI